MTLIVLNSFAPVSWFRPFAVVLLTTNAGILVFLCYRIYTGESTLSPDAPLRRYPFVLLAFAAGYLLFSLSHTFSWSI
jgi:hypothetical protein